MPIDIYGKIIDTGELTKQTIDPTLLPQWLTPAGSVGTQFEQKSDDFHVQAISPQGKAITYSVVGGQIPYGFTFDPLTGRIYGTLEPVQYQEVYRFTIRATDSGTGFYADQKFTYTVQYDTPPALPVISLGTAIENSVYTVSLAATDPDYTQTLVYTFESGYLPNGIVFNTNTALVSGTLPAANSRTKSDNYTFSIGVTDGIKSDTQSYTLTVTPDFYPVWHTGGIVIEQLHDTNAATTVLATDPNGTPITYTVNDNSLPAFMTLNATTGSLTGYLPNVVQDTTWYVNITASKNSGKNAVANHVIIDWINTPPDFSSAPSPGLLDPQSQLDGTYVDIAFTTKQRESFPVTYFVSNGVLPPGLALDANTGIMSGTLAVPPANSVNYPFTINAVVESTGLYATRSYSYTVRKYYPLYWNTANNTLLSNALAGQVLPDIYVSASSPVGLSVTYGLANGTTLPGTVQHPDPIGETGVAFDGVTGKISGRNPLSYTNLTYPLSIAATDGRTTVYENFTFNVLANLPPAWQYPNTANTVVVFEGNAFTIPLLATDPENQGVSYQLPFEYQYTEAFGGFWHPETYSDGTGAIVGTMPTHDANGPIPNDVGFAFPIVAFDGVNYNEIVINATDKFTTPPAIKRTNLTIVGLTTVSTSIEASTLSGSLNVQQVDGQLPPGLSMDTLGNISGTVPQFSNTTTYTVDVSASNPVGVTNATITFNCVTNVPPVWDTANGTQVASGLGNLSLSGTVQAHDINGLPVTYSLVGGALPPGVSYHTTGEGTCQISGAPAIEQADTTFSFEMIANNGFFSSNAETFTVEVLQQEAPYWITSGGELGPFIETYSFSRTLTAHDPQALNLTFSISNGALPSGVTLASSTGVISGTAPNAVVETAYNFDVTVTDGTASLNQTRSFQITVNHDLPPVWSNGATYIGKVLAGTPVQPQVSASATDPNGLQVTYSLGYSANAAPGINITSSGQFQGTLGQIGANATYTMNVAAFDGRLYTYKNFTVDGEKNNPPYFVNAAACSGYLGNTNELAAVPALSFAAVDPEGQPVTYKVVGSIPPGFNVDGNGNTFGTIGAIANTTLYTFSVIASDGVLTNSVTASLQVNYVEPPVFVSNTNLGTFYTGLPVNSYVIATDPLGTPTYTCNTAELPDGLTFLANGLLTGYAPLVEMQQTFALDVTANCAMKTANTTLHYTVLSVQPPNWSTKPGNLYTGLEGNTVNVALLAVDPQHYPITYDVVDGSLPDGLYLNANTGIISGTLSSSISQTVVSNFTIGADNGVISSQLPFSITNVYDAPPIWMSNSALGNVYELSNFSTLLVANSPVNQPLTYTVATGSTLPSGLTLYSNGVLTGRMPAVSSNTVYTFSVNASDGQKKTAQTFVVADIYNPGLTDNYLSSVGVLCHFDGNLTDVMGGHAIGGTNITYDTTTKLAGTSSVRLKATSPSYLTIPTDSDTSLNFFYMSSPNLTWEFSFLPTTMTQTANLLYAQNSNPGGEGIETEILVIFNSGGTITVTNPYTSEDKSLTFPLPFGLSWYSLALEMTGGGYRYDQVGTISVWLNGVKQGVISNYGYPFTPAAPTYIGTGPQGSFDGWIDELRITKASRYSATYQPYAPFPTAPSWVTPANNVMATATEGNTFQSNALVVTDPNSTGLGGVFANTTALPSGVTLTSAGVLQGTMPTYQGVVDTFTANATDGVGNPVVGGVRTFDYQPTISIPSNLLYSWRFNRPAGTAVSATSDIANGVTTTPQTGSSSGTLSYVAAPSPYGSDTAISIASGSYMVWAMQSGLLNLLEGNQWTVELWLATGVGNTNSTTLCIYGNNFRLFYYGQTGGGDNKMHLNFLGSPVTPGAGTITSNVWHHYAFVRNGTTLTGYLDGVAGTPITVGSAAGGFGGNNLYLNCYYDSTNAAGTYSPASYFRNLRFWNVPRYSANFTPTWNSFPY